MSKYDNYGKRILKNIGIFTSRIFGENSYAKYQIFDERVSQSSVAIGIQKLVNGIPLADFKLSKSAQLGYVAALADLQEVGFSRVYFVSLWATGQNDDVVINRAAGQEFANYIQEVDDKDRFIIGYQTALIHFMNGITGDKGIVNQIITEIHEHGGSEFVENWFADTNTKLGELDPLAELTGSNLNLKQVQDTVASLFTELAANKLNINQFANGNIAIKREHVNDFLTEVALTASELSQFKYQDVFTTINQFVDQQLVPMLNLLSTGLMQWYSTHILNENNMNLLGLPHTSSQQIRDYIEFPNSIDEFFEKMAIFNLSRYSQSRSGGRDNYQLKYSVELINNESLIDKYGDQVKIKYGVFDLIYQELVEVLTDQSLIPMAQYKKRQFNEIRLGIYDGTEANKDQIIEVSFTIRSERVMKKLINDAIVLADIGRKDRLALTNARSLSSFVRNLNDDKWAEFNYDVEKINRPTRKVLYWIYQSTFIGELDADEVTEAI
ncbi:hypothetical protein [Lentilactobacillus kosonis]|uniref:Uncharacterized protein n=1 Tax=Lentilactobacillus kosonis TaxID=2810561 RepID=A0A401FJN2_9LACO|nr:hypothetical protein [Lentilactobacillus kosonis]GAY72572.1 hypothetical protein NBRC111893_718 [Lentilactobacillus kosonis]